MPKAHDGPVGSLFAAEPDPRAEPFGVGLLASLLRDAEEERRHVRERELAHAPIGRSALPDVLTNPTIPDDPVVCTIGGGSRPIRRSEYEAIRDGSLRLFADASMIGGAPLAPRVTMGAARRTGGRRGSSAPEGEMEPLAAPTVRSGGGGPLFDYRRLAEVPDVPQAPLPRYEPPRGVPDRVADLVDDPKVRRQMLQVVDRGEQMGGREWYNVEPLRKAFIDELGEVEGAAAFGRYVDLIGATSARNPIGSNVRTASYYHGLLSRGDPIPEKPDPPYGGLAQGDHRRHALRLAEEGGWDPLRNPKLASYAANITGNQLPGTIDTHAARLPAMLSRDPRFLETGVQGAPRSGGGFETLNPRGMLAEGELSLKQALERPGFWYSVPEKNEYAAMERYYADLARRRDMTTAQAQASAWVGGGERTGLVSEPVPLLRIIENRIRLTAEQRGERPVETLRKMIRGQAPLLSVGGVSAEATREALQALDEAGLD